MSEYRCLKCTKKFTTKYNLQRHDKICTSKNIGDDLIDKVTKLTEIIDLQAQQFLEYKKLTNDKIILLESEIETLKNKYCCDELDICDELESCDDSESDIDLFSISEELELETKPKSNQFVYLLQEREFLKSGEPVYKIGRTTSLPNTRLAGYPKGSRVIYFLDVTESSCKHIEKQLIKKFDKLYIQRSDIGREYYKGNLGDMKSTFLKLVMRSGLGDTNISKLEEEGEKEEEGGEKEEGKKWGEGVEEEIEEGEVYKTYAYIANSVKFLDVDEYIFKIGKTKLSFDERLAFHKKGESRLMICREIGSDNRLWNNLIARFDKKHIKRSDIGQGYYEGKTVKIVNTFRSVFIKP